MSFIKGHSTSTTLCYHVVCYQTVKFSEFSRAINLLFHRLLQQTGNVTITFIKGHSTSMTLCYHVRLVTKQCLVFQLTFIGQVSTP